MSVHDANTMISHIMVPSKEADVSPTVQRVPESLARSIVAILIEVVASWQQSVNLIMKPMFLCVFSGSGCFPCSSSAKFEHF